MHGSHSIPLGPYHPLLKEPEHVKIFVRGENIINAELALGYNHRGIEKLFESRPYHKAIFLAERICGICSIAHASCFTNLVEKTLNVEVSERAKAIRSIAGELNRIHSHLLWFSVLMHSLGFETLFMHAMAFREPVLNALERMTGGRIHYSLYEYGGVRRDLTFKTVKEIRKTLHQLKKNTRLLFEEFNSHSILIERLKGVGKLKKEKAIELGVVGPTLRGSNVKSDLRKDEPYEAYERVDFNVITEKGSDSLARALVRFKEIEESIHIIEQLLESLPAGPVRGNMNIKVKPGLKECFHVEAPRGENFHYLITGKLTPERLRVRPPTYANFAALPALLKGHFIADAPAAIMSIDPCFSCTDRAVVINLNSGKKQVKEFRELGSEKT